LAWVLFLLVVFGITGIFVWDFRRKSAARDAASKKRFEEIFQARAAAASAPGAPAAAASPAAPPEAKTPVASAAPPARDRFLGQHETLLYRLLKAGIPDHEIFANVALPSVVGGRSEHELRRLAQYRVDFVVCDKGMRVVAAVEIEPASGMQAAGEHRFVSECLKAAGVNVVRLNPASLPRREEIRALVCGRPSPADS
jgi:uncharacterized protein DUF2726